VSDPCTNRFSRRFGDLKLNRALCLLLHHNRACCHCPAMADIAHPKLNDIACPEFAVDSQIEKG
jgi:hypothetical protein